MAKHDLSVELCEEILERAEAGYLAMCRDGHPYCLPFNFAYCCGKIYIHTGRKGLKWDFLNANPRVCFTVAETSRKKTGESPCQYTYEFDSVVVSGTACLVEDPEETAASLQKIIDKYREAPVLPVPPDKLTKLKMLRIDIEKITGRQNR